MSNWSRDLYGVKLLSEVSSSATIIAGSLEIDLSQGTTFNVDLNANVTSFSITNPQSGSSAFTLFLTADGTQRAVSWGASVLWAGGFSPTITSGSGKVDIFGFVSRDSGTSWYAFVGGQNL